MKHYTRVVGWLLLGMGVVLGGLGLLALGGLLAVQIDFFGANLDTRPERIVWTAAWLLAAAVGLSIVGLGRRAPKALSGLGA